MPKYIPGARTATRPSNFSAIKRDEDKPKTTQGQSAPKSLKKSELREIVGELVNHVLGDAPAIRELVKTDFAQAQSNIIAALQEGVTQLGNEHRKHYDTIVAGTLDKLEEIRKASQRVVTIQRPDMPDAILAGLQHKSMPELIQALAAGNPILMVGPTQAGKSRSVKEAAKALGLDFTYHAFGPTQTESTLKGYLNATGVYVGPKA